ncbi:hypothetical protein PAHAL_9G424900 [Panicum hallii]|uniref:Uncharacterized protein n=1 Tax=Panicum hallii TaxID=206008 RepID=A0A2T8I4E6_9POAL|nr:hypothetical protein PAHAL_9G424900 [Panicum hallii]
MHRRHPELPFETRPGHMTIHTHMRTGSKGGGWMTRTFPSSHAIHQAVRGIQEGLPQKKKGIHQEGRAHTQLEPL